MINIMQGSFFTSILYAKDNILLIWYKVVNLNGTFCCPDAAFDSKSDEFIIIIQIYFDLIALANKSFLL